MEEGPLFVEVIFDMPLASPVWNAEHYNSQFMTSLAKERVRLP
jgi:hypothetical protein